MSSKALVTAIASSFLLASALQAQTTYQVNRTVALGSISGTIETDGTTATPLAVSNILDWNLTLDDGEGNMFNLTGPLSGNNSHVFISGSDVTASATSLSFNFNGVDAGYFAFQPVFGSGMHYYCDADSGQAVCEVGESVVPATLATIQNVPAPADNTIGTGSGSPVLTINSPASLPVGTQGNPYNPVTFMATGGTGTGYTWSETGALPTGVGFGPAGVLSGTPTNSGSFPITFKVTDSGSNSATLPLTLTINRPLTIASPLSLSAGTQGAAYGPVNFAAIGGTGTGYTWSETGALPTGVGFGPAGVLSGTPTNSGSFPITFKVTDSGSNSATLPLTLTINGPLSISSPSSLSAGTQGTAYGPVSFAATGGGVGYTWSETGALPTGMSFSAAGVLSGTPTNFGAFPITFKVTDSGSNSATLPLILTINSLPLTISSPASLPGDVQGTPYGPVTFTATGGTGSGYTWSETGALPAGMSFSAGGVLSGTPTQFGTFPITFKATDSGSNSGTAALTLTILLPALTVSSPATLPAGAQGVAYNPVTFAAAGGSGTGYTWSETGALPSGMSFSAGGVLSGTPTASGSFPITFKVTDSLSNAATTTLTLTINTPGLTISSPATLPAGSQGAAYNPVTFAATGGSGTGYTWSETGALPSGMSFSGAGVLSGTPAASGSFPITFKVTDSASNAATATLTLTINAAAQLTIGSPASLPAGAQGVAYNPVTFAAAGGSGTGYTWSETGALPSGMSFSAGGVLSGTPTASGSFPITFKVTDSLSNAATTTLTLTINTPGLTISSPATLPAGSQGVAYNPVTFAATGGTGAGYTWSETGALPSGMSFSAGGVLSGTPTASGSFPITFKVTDSASNAATATLTLTINAAAQLTIGTTSLPSGTLGVQYVSATFTATGGTGAGYTWSETGALPSGMSFSAGGVLSGTPGSSGSFSITFKVTDSGSNSATATLTLTIATSTQLTIGTTSLPAGTLGVQYGPLTFAAVGGTGFGYTWSETGALPSGMSFSSGGVLNGIPASLGITQITFKVTDSGGNTATETLSLAINTSLTIGSPASLPAATEGSPYSQTFQATGGTGAGYAWSVSGQPTGLTINPATGVFGGTPASGASAGSPYTVQVSVVDSGGDSTSVALKLTVNSGSLTGITLSTNSLTFSFIQGGTTPVTQSFGVSGATGQTAFSVSASTTSGGSWLTASAVSGQTPGNVTVGLQNLSSLSVGMYQGSVLVQPQGQTGGQSVSVTLQVLSSQPQFSLSSTDVRFAVTAGSPAVSGTIQVNNTGGGTLSFSAGLDTPASWLNITCGTQGISVTTGSPGLICLQVNPVGLAPQTYTDTLAVLSGGQEIDATVTLQINSSATALVLSATAITFTAIAGSPVVSPSAQSSAVVNTGAGTLNWTAQLDAATPVTWLDIEPASGNSLAYGGSQPAVTFTPNPAGLAAGDYYAVVDVASADAPGASAQTVILLKVLPSGSQVPPAASASGLIFTVLVGGSISTPQTLTFTSANGQAVGFTALLATGLSAAGQQIPDWVSGLPASGTIPGSGNFPISMQANPGSLAVGTYSSQLRFGFSNGTSENVAVVMLVTTLPKAGTTALLESAQAISAAASAGTLPACTANLALVFTQPLPAGLQAGNAVTMDLSAGCSPTNYKDINPSITIYNSSQQQLSQFTLQSGLTYIGNGVFEASWQSPVYLAGQTISIVGSANPFLPGLSVAPPSPAAFSLYLPSADASAAVDLGVRNAASFGTANEVAPGSFISIFGQQLATQPLSASTVPFPTSMEGVQVTLGKTLLPLYFVSATQINAIVPFLSGSSLNGAQTLILYTNCPPVGPACQVTAPLNLNVVPIQPGIFSQTAQGNGQGSIQNASYQLVDASHPAKAGDEIVIYATGLGPVTNPPPAGSVSPGGNITTLTPTVYFGSIPAATPAYSGLTPGSVDLYQVNVVVPQGVPAGTVNVMLQMTDASGSIPITYQSNVVTIATTK